MITSEGFFLEVEENSDLMANIRFKKSKPGDLSSNHIKTEGGETQSELLPEIRIKKNQIYLGKSKRFYFFCDNLFFSARAFLSKSTEHYSAWIFDGSALELVN